MSSWIPVSRTEHAQSYWKPRQGYEFAAAKQVVPVMLAELSRLVPNYVLGFVRDENENFKAVALVGLGGDRNLYITPDSKWLCEYVPAALRAFPFTVLKSTDGNNVFCIQSDHLSESTEHERLLDDDGELGVRTAETYKFISHCELNRNQTAEACEALAQAAIIEPWPISVSRGEGEEPRMINGLHRINEEALNELDAENLAGLRVSGALLLAYAQLFSMAQLDQLTRRAEYLSKSTAQTSSSADMANLFSSDDSGSLNFDALEPASNDTETQ